MTTRWLLSAGALALFSETVLAQRPLFPAPEKFPVVRVAKWALLGAAIGFGGYALTHHARANRTYESLRAMCEESPERCVLEGSRYSDAEADGLYRRSVAEDRRARTGIVGGQVTLIGSAALFLYDLRNGRGPDNIPYPSSTLRHAKASRSGGIRLGLRLSI